MVCERIEPWRSLKEGDAEQWQFVVLIKYEKFDAGHARQHSTYV